ncbi:unnamed protein product [Bursaphelenchus xylophilus]|uniref:(pine wood nematode) hypothetical protein n=1 Tax=Bursaphelenchus xylophilus TaxID=6326 RepID=A0A1I7RVC4_BURXY|nr:unnamed protein product [Bursaphelenchus xylophilus]CAG9086671.1 unnamed protein product [Bursaphelenchus xylophilus]
MTTVSIQHHITSELRHVTFADQVNTESDAITLSSECSRYIVNTFLFCQQFQENRYGNKELVNLSPLEIALLSKKFFQTTCGIVRSQRARNYLKLFFTRPPTTTPIKKPPLSYLHHEDLIGWGSGNGRFYKISSSPNSSLVLLWYIRPKPQEIHIHIDFEHDISEKMHQMVLSIIAGAKRVNCSTEIGRAHLLQYDMIRVLQPCLREIVGGVDVMAGVPPLDLEELCVKGPGRMEYGTYMENHCIKRLILKDAYIGCNRNTKVNNKSKFFTNLRNLKVFGATYIHHGMIKVWADYGLNLDKFLVSLDAEMREDQLPEAMSIWFDLLTEYPNFSQKSHISADLITYQRNRTSLNSFCYQRFPRFLVENFGHPDELDCIEFMADFDGVLQRCFTVRFENSWISVATKIRVISM